MLTPSMLISRAQAAEALGVRAHTFFPATHVSSTSVRASSCGFDLCRVAVDDDEVGPFARLERTDPVLGEAGVSRAARVGCERLLEGQPLATESSRRAAGR